MNKTMIFEEELIAGLQSPDAEVRRKAAEQLGNLASGDEQEVSALIDVMHNDCEYKVREMACWALSSPANLKILSQHPEWEAQVQALGSGLRKKTPWWQSLLARLKLD